MTQRYAALRRRLTLAGGHASDGVVDASHTRRDDAEYRLATVIDAPLRHIDVGTPEAFTEDVAFLDGTQQTELLGYIGNDPVLVADVSAGVRLRQQRVFTTAEWQSSRLVIARPRALQQFPPLPEGTRVVPLEDASTPHPIADMQRGRILVDRARAALEIAVAAAFRARARDCWLIVDGSLAVSPGWSTDTRMLGVVKSHAMLPFADDELATYLQLPAGHRTSVFQPDSQRVTPLFAWGLRLHACAGRDLFHGLIRVEAPASDATLENATMLSRQLLAERAPLSNDARADRLLYGIHDVERYLRAVRG